MSDQWGVTPDEQNAARTGGFGGNINIGIPGLPEMTAGIKALTQQLQELRSTMSSFGQNQHSLGQGVANTLNTVQTSALSATDSVKTFFQSLTGARPGASSLATVLDYGLSTGLPQDLAMFPLRYMQSTIGQNRQFALNMGGALAGQQFATGIATAGSQGMFGRLSRTLGANLPGLPTGTGDEIAQFMQVARQAGAMMDLTRWSGSGWNSTPQWTAGGNPRTAGFFGAAYQMQQMNPSMPLGQIGQVIGGFAANSAAQRMGAYLTGGAFSMVAPGGGLKTISEWAESILRWLETQRPGPKRGQGFTYDELISQQYPGSNIDAWFDANGVPPEMQEQFWNYALAKARTSSNTTGAAMDITKGLPGGVPNPAMSRLRSTTPLTQSSFGLAGRLAGNYAQREDANREFNRMMGSTLQKVMPAVLRGPLGFLREMPDPVEEFLMSLMERVPLLGPALGGAIGWGGLAAAGTSGLYEGLLSETGPLFGGLLDAIGSVAGGGEMATQLRDALTSLLSTIADPASAMFGSVMGQGSRPQWLVDLMGGDVGDVGGYGDMGGTTTSSLHPSMNRKVSAMMKANPRLRLNSGRRDEVLQRRLKSRGHSRVSGKSSAHTRGLAADLGPRSEYPWIVANARKFGLRSGIGEGEPWHVGMPGIGDIRDIGEASNAPVDPATTPTAPATSTTSTTSYTPYTGAPGVGALLSLFGGGAGNVAGSMGGLLSFLFGGFGSSGVAGTAEEDAAAYDPESTRRAFAAATYTVGGQYGAGSIIDQVAAAIKAKLAGTTGTSTTTSQGGTGSEDLAGALKALGLDPGGSPGAQVAKLAHHAGFTGDDLVKAVAIAGRESSFVPTAHRSDVDKALMRGDRGLWQINAGAWNKLLIEQGYIKDPLDRAIFDPWVNAQIARMIFLRSNNFSAWTMGPNGWDPNGDPFYGTDRNAALGYVKEAGLGDVDNYPMQPIARPTLVGGGGPVQFNNTFVIQGGGGNGGMDTRRVVTMLADQLESEMRRRTARSN